jgi:hypothetical protein
MITGRMEGGGLPVGDNSQQSVLFGKFKSKGKFVPVLN